MVKHELVFGLLAAATVVSLSVPVWSQHPCAGPQPAGEETRTFTFDSDDSLNGWTITGNVAVDMTKGRQPNGSSLKIGPGGKALLKLREKDESGKVENLGLRRWHDSHGREGPPCRPAMGTRTK